MSDKRGRYAWLIALGVMVGCAAQARAQSETDYFDNATGLMGQKKFAEAEAEFRKSIHVDPRYKEAWQGLAEALTAQGKDATAVTRMAASAPDVRAGNAPPLSDEQKVALGEAAGATPPDPTPANSAPTAKRRRTIRQPGTNDPNAAQPPAPTQLPAPVQQSVPVQPPEQARPAAAVPLAANVPDVPLEQSAIVIKNADGVPAVGGKDGKPIDGVKLSHYDCDIFSPQIATTADGTIHVVFAERQQASPYAYFIFHRSSSDGGATWSESKNLSESMAGVQVGFCRIVVDAQDRLVVVWRTGLGPGFPVGQTPAGNIPGNLVARVLDHGKWSKIIPVSKPGSTETQDDGANSYTLLLDQAGHAQAIYAVLPDKFDPEKFTVVSPGYSQHINTIGKGMLMEATIDGATPPAPHQIYLANFKVDPKEPKYGRKLDDLDALEGYIDPHGTPHLVARALLPGDFNSASTQLDLIDGDTQKHFITLPGAYTQLEANPPKLLVDAQGHQHVIVQFNGGEHPAFRDYAVGNEEEPTTILAAKGDKGTCMGFQAFQGPGGKMVVLMQTTDEGYNDAGDTWLSTSTDGTWSTPLCVTNNAGRAKYWAKDTGVLSGVAGGSRYGPGPGAATFDKDGHLLLAVVNAECGSFGLSAGGVVYSSGSTRTPKLFFYKF